MALNSLGSSSVTRGVVLHDINAEKATTDPYFVKAVQYQDSYLPIQGYKKLYLNGQNNFSYRLVYGGSWTTVSANTWVEIDISSNNGWIDLMCGNATYCNVYYSMLA